MEQAGVFLFCSAWMTAPHVPAQVLTKTKIQLYCGLWGRKQNLFSAYECRKVTPHVFRHLSRGPILEKYYISKAPYKFLGKLTDNNEAKIETGFCSFCKHNVQFCLLHKWAKQYKGTVNLEEKLSSIVATVLFVYLCQVSSVNYIRRWIWKSYFKGIQSTWKIITQVTLKNRQLNI